MSLETPDLMEWLDSALLSGGTKPTAPPSGVDPARPTPRPDDDDFLASLAKWEELPPNHAAHLLVRNLRFHVHVDTDKLADPSVDCAIMTVFAASLKHGSLVAATQSYALAASPLPTAAEMEGLTRVQVRGPG